MVIRDSFLGLHGYCTSKETSARLEAVRLITAENHQSILLITIPLTPFLTGRGKEVKKDMRRRFAPAHIFFRRIQ
jgi:hypothetical protein